jgi:hypothetical protein
VTLFGIDLLDTSLRGIHAMMAAAWLILDFVVYWLHFKIKDATAPVDERLERARVMHGIDTVVAYVFLLMMPTGVALAYMTGTALWTTEWLNWKHVLYAIIVVDALYLLPISGTALTNLKAIKAGAPDVDALNREIKARMDRAQPAVFLIWALVFAASVISLLNLKAPPGQEYIFRKTAAEVSSTTPR